MAGDSAAHRRDWEELAKLDPCWAILSAPGTRLGGWDLEDFLATGRPDVAQLMEHAAGLGRPAHRGRALDFGCGVGRHSRVLAEHFDSVVGVDVSEEMVALARRINSDRPGLEFVVNASDRLDRFADGEFDLVQSQLVLQHLPSEEAILGYVAELARVTKEDGLLFFQVPVGTDARQRLQPRRRLYRALRAVGVTPAFLFRRLGLNPVRMTSVPAERVEATLGGVGARVLESQAVPVGEGYASRTYWVA